MFMSQILFQYHHENDFLKTDHSNVTESAGAVEYTDYNSAEV